jgi:hypothetical protein
MKKMARNYKLDNLAERIEDAEEFDWLWDTTEAHDELIEDAYNAAYLAYAGPLQMVVDIASPEYQECYNM